MLQAAAKRSTTSVMAVGKQDRHLLGRQRNRHATTEHKRSKVSTFLKKVGDKIHVRVRPWTNDKVYYQAAKKISAGG